MLKVWQHWCVCRAIFVPWISHDLAGSRNGCQQTHTHTHAHKHVCMPNRLVIILPLLLSAVPIADFLAALEELGTAIGARRDDSTVHQQSDLALAKYDLP